MIKGIKINTLMSPKLISNRERFECANRFIGWNKNIYAPLNGAFFIG